VSILAAAGVLVVLVTLAVVVLRTRVADHEPRLASTVELLALVAIGVVPPLVLACGATSWARVLESLLDRALPALARSATVVRLFELGLVALAGLLVARLFVFGLLAARAVLRTELRGLCRARAALWVLPTGDVTYVLPSDRIVAYAAGIRRPVAVTTTALLGLLEPAEQEAVVRHEVAHVRLGHPRIGVLATAVGRAYWWLPPARALLRRLGRDLEAAADDEVVAAIGSEPLLRALAKVALAQVRAAPVSPSGGPAGPVEAFADPQDLRYRIQRLERPGPLHRRGRIVLGTLATVLLGACAVALCAACHARLDWASLTPCAVLLAAIGGRPACGRRPFASLRAPQAP
jgi:Zn-dependent protease with chaperone function